MHLNQRHELVGREVRYTVCGLLGYDFMQDRLCEQSIEIHSPEIVVNIPRTLGNTLEFYKAQEMVEEGRTAAKKAIADWKQKQPE